MSTNWGGIIFCIGMFIGFIGKCFLDTWGVTHE